MLITRRKAFAMIASVVLLLAGCKSTEQTGETTTTTTTTTTTSKNTVANGNGGKSSSTTSSTTTSKTSTTTGKNGSGTNGANGANGKTGSGANANGAKGTNGKTGSGTNANGTNGANGKTGSGTNANGANGANGKNGSGTDANGANGANGGKTSAAQYAENNQKLLAQVEQSRKEAIAAGAEQASGLAFKTAEAEYEAEKAAIAAGQKTDMSQSLKDLDQRYKGLAALARAKQKKAEIDDNDLAANDQKSYDEGSALVEELSSSKAAMYTGDDFYKKASQAENDFDNVLKASGRDTTKVNPDTYPVSNKRLFDQVEKSRKEAIEAGAPHALPDRFSAAEADYNNKKTIVDNQEKVDISSSLRDLNNNYKAMAAIARAQEKKKIIDDEGLSSYSMSNYTRGTSLLDEVTTSKADNLSSRQLYTKASDAEKAFDNVLLSAYRAQAEKERQAAYAAKRKAESVKAQVSRKDQYVTGVDQYRAGYSKFSAGNPKDSMQSFKDSKETFTNLYEEISVARAEALKKIQDAKKRVEESESVAKTADKEAPLGNQPVKGIEAEDAKLLEDDDFSYTENTEIEVDTTPVVSAEEAQ